MLQTSRIPLQADTWSHAPVHAPSDAREFQAHTLWGYCCLHCGCSRSNTCNGTLGTHAYTLQERRHAFTRGHTFAVTHMNTQRTESSQVHPPPMPSRSTVRRMSTLAHLCHPPHSPQTPYHPAPPPPKLGSTEQCCAPLSARHLATHCSLTLQRPSKYTLIKTFLL